MRKAVVDLKGFSIKRLKEPQYNHFLYLLGWVGYFVLYFLTELFIPPENCHVIYSPLDDMIPFCEVFVVPYVLWYASIVGTLVYFGFYSPESFKKVQSFIIFTQITAMAIYIIYPSIQLLRPAEMPRDNFFTDIIGLLYSVDTNTNVCPSLHVGYSLAMISVWLKEKGVPVWVKTAITVFLITVCLSTVFIKQHSVVDAFVAIPMCLIAEIILYKDYYKEKFKIKKAAV